MALRSAELPATFWRGGTSKAVVFRRADLPQDQGEWDAVLIAAMGSPDPYGRQLDGMGGGISSLSKVCILGPASRDDADVDFTFAQVPVGPGPVDYGGNCGNMISAMGPAALDLGYVAPPRGGMAHIRIHNTNTGKIIQSHFPVENGLLAVGGDLVIDGVSGHAAPIRLEFLNPGGAKTGRLLPTGRAVDHVTIGGQRIAVSLVDAANPCVFVAAEDLGKSATEHPDDLAVDQDFMQRMEEIRRAGSVRVQLWNLLGDFVGNHHDRSNALSGRPRLCRHAGCDRVLRVRLWPGRRSDDGPDDLSRRHVLGDLDASGQHVERSGRWARQLHGRM